MSHVPPYTLGSVAYTKMPGAKRATYGRDCVSWGALIGLSPPIPNSSSNALSCQHGDSLALLYGFDHRTPRKATFIPSLTIMRAKHLVAVAVVVTGAVGITLVLLFSDASDHSRSPESTGNARAAIASLPYHLVVTEQPRGKGILVGHASVNGTDSFRFYVLVNRPAPRYLQARIGTKLSAVSLSPGYSYLGPLTPAGRTRAEKNGETAISLAVQDSLCRQATAHACHA